MNTLNWIKSQEHPNGGIMAWEGHEAYPEVTGYLIPTLITWGEGELAERCADWLESVQSPDGSFSSMGGVPHAFDTAAIVEGLKATGRQDAAQLALSWLETQLKPSGLLQIHADTDEVHARDFRSLAIMGRNLDDVQSDLIENVLAHAGRYHYFMYALEGMLNMGYEKRVANLLEGVKRDTASNLLPNTLDGRGSDTTATAQAACLRLRLGLPAEDWVEAVRSVVNVDGSLPHDKSDTRKIAWACKYYLDMENLLEQEPPKEETPVVRTPRKRKSK